MNIFRHNWCRNWCYDPPIASIKPSSERIRVPVIFPPPLPSSNKKAFRFDEIHLSLSFFLPDLINRPLVQILKRGAKDGILIIYI